MATATEDDTATGTESPDDELAIARANKTPDTDPPDGKSIDDMAADGELEESKPLPPMKQSIPGTQQTISASFGGTRPSESEIRLMGGKLPVEGSWAKGEEVLLLVRAKIGGVLGQDVLDDWGASQRTVRRHFARMIEVRALTPAAGGGYELTDQQKIEGL